MKATVINSIKPILTDRLMTILMIMLIIVCLAYCVYVGVSLRPSDLQVAVRYSAFGETSFYRDKWYYLITFIAFGVLVAVVHTVLTAKIYLQGRRQLAVLFTWLSILLIVIAWFMTWAVLKVAFL